MDEFQLEIATSNDDLVKILMAFRKVEEKIDNFDDWSSGLDRLEVRSNEVSEGDYSSISSIILVAFILPLLFVTSYVLLKISLIWIIKKAFKKFRGEDKDKEYYAKLEENKPEKVDPEDTDRISRRCLRQRNIVEMFGQDIWLVLGFVLFLLWATKARDDWGANTGSVQIFIGDGDMNLQQIGEFSEETLKLINEEMFSARALLSDAVVMLDKYDGEIQDIILSKIDRVVEKGDLVADRSSRLSEYLEECLLKQKVISLSLLYFIVYIGAAYLGVRFSLSGLGHGLTANLTRFLLGLASHSFLLLTSVVVWTKIFVPLLTMFIYSYSSEMLFITDTNVGIF